MASNDDLLYVLRVYDSFDRQWSDDLTEPLTLPEAETIWNEKTEQGTKSAKKDDMSYYKIFPAKRKMLGHSGFNRKEN